MSSEKFCLRWNDFETNISGAFRELRDDKDFFDVTIACEDEQMQAHKVILSACSPFFRNILRRNQHQHPLLYLKGVKYTDLQSVLNFMYHGEVNVAQEELNSFLSVAEDLRVKGLTQSQGNATSTRHREQSPPRSSKPRVVEREPPPPPKRPKPPATQTFTSVQQSTNFTPQDQDDDIQELPPVKTEPRDTPVYPAPAIQVNHPDPQDDTQQHQLVQQDQYGEEGTMGEYEDYGHYGDSSYDDGQYGQVMEQQADGGKDGAPNFGVYIQKFPENGPKAQLCTICRKSFCDSSTALKHVENIHFPDTFLYSCRVCGEQFTKKNAMYKHISKYHKP